LLDDTKVCGGMKAPISFLAFLAVGEHTLKRDFLWPFGFTSIISMTLRQEGDLREGKIDDDEILIRIDCGGSSCCRLIQLTSGGS
jgi:hypothetical protein